MNELVMRFKLNIAYLFYPHDILKSVTKNYGKSTSSHTHTDTCSTPYRVPYECNYNQKLQSLCSQELASIYLIIVKRKECLHSSIVIEIGNGFQSLQSDRIVDMHSLATITGYRALCTEHHWRDIKCYQYLHKCRHTVQNLHRFHVSVW